MTFKQVILIRVGLICTWCKFTTALVTNVSQEPLCFISLRVRQNKPGLTQLAGDLSCALALRDALILVDRDAWTVCRDSWANKANCHVALALPGLADSNLARRRGGYQPATALYKEKNMNTHATCRRRCTRSYSSARCHAMWPSSPPSFTPSYCPYCLVPFRPNKNETSTH